jgi:hypothetical protein
MLLHLLTTGCGTSRRSPHRNKLGSDRRYSGHAANSSGLLVRRERPEASIWRNAKAAAKAGLFDCLLNDSGSFRFADNLGEFGLSGRRAVRLSPDRHLVSADMPDRQSRTQFRTPPIR